MGEDAHLEATSMAMGEEATPTTEIPDFRDLYEQHSRAVYLAALRVTGNPADAEDVLQTVFVRLIDSGPVLDGSRTVGPYLRRAAVNAAIDLLRRRQVRGDADVPEQDPAPGGAAESTRDRDGGAVLKERLRRALASLPPGKAELFVLFHLEGYRYEELAEMLHLEPGTVGSRLHRIRATLQEELNR